jgi:hypothetical protein
LDPGKDSGSRDNLYGEGQLAYGGDYSIHAFLEAGSAGFVEARCNAVRGWFLVVKSREVERGRVWVERNWVDAVAGLGC